MVGSAEWSAGKWNQSPNGDIIVAAALAEDAKKGRALLMKAERVDQGILF